MSRKARLIFSRLSATDFQPSLRDSAEGDTKEETADRVRSYNQLKADNAALQRNEGNTAQSAFGISWKICALISSLFLEVHKVHLRKSAFIRTQIFSGSALAELCGIALEVHKVHLQKSAIIRTQIFSESALAA